MGIVEVLTSGAGATVVDQLARAHGVSSDDARRVVASVVPQLAERIERNTLNRGGVADLIGALGYARAQDYLAAADAITNETVRRDGIAFLDQLLWSKDKSRAVAHRAAAATGVGEEIVKAMLPSIAAAMMGGLAKASSGSLEDILSRIPGLPGASGGNRGGAGLPGAGGPLAGPATSAPAPLPGGASGGGVGQQAPLPIPGGLPGGGGWGGGWGGGSQGQNPYGDLSDIIRKGGQSVPGAGGGGLSNIIRTILGAVLGFQNRGVLSWIIRYVVLRYGWSILRGLMSIVLGRRM